MFTLPTVRLSSLALALGLGAAAAGAQTRYTLTDIGIPDALQVQSSTSVVDINNRGQVLIRESNRQNAWLYTPGQNLLNLASVMPATPPPTWSTRVTGAGLNEAGQIVGEWEMRSNVKPTEGTASKAFVYTPGSGTANLAPAGRSELVTPEAINDRGQVLGSMYSNFGHVTFLQDVRTGHTDQGFDRLIVRNGGAVNNAGVVGGGYYTPQNRFHAALFADGALQDIGALDGGAAQVTALNESGWAVGWGSTRDYDVFHVQVNHPFLYRPGVGMTDLGAFGASNQPAFANDVNELGQVVGLAALDVASDRHAAFIYDLAFGQRNLNDLLDPLTGAGWELLSAEGINDRGQIAGTGRFDGENRAFLLTPVSLPVPEPSALALLMAGACITVVGARRRRGG